jgi:hypothetical protein
MASKNGHVWVCNLCHLKSDFIAKVDNIWVCPQCHSQNIHLASKYEQEVSEKKDVVETFQCPSTVEVPGDSSICHYCQRKQFYDKSFDDGRCSDCIGDKENPYSNFLGVNCVANKSE